MASKTNQEFVSASAFKAWQKHAAWYFGLAIDEIQRKERLPITEEKMAAFCHRMEDVIGTLLIRPN